MTNIDIDEIKAIVSQDVDSADYDSDSSQELEIDIIDAGGGYYIVLSTRRWAIDTSRDLEPVLKLMDGLVKLANNLGGKHGDSGKDFN